MENDDRLIKFSAISEAIQPLIQEQAGTIKRTGITPEMMDEAKRDFKTLGDFFTSKQFPHPEQEAVLIEKYQTIDNFFHDFPPTEDWEHLTGLKNEELNDLPYPVALIILKAAAKQGGDVISPENAVFIPQTTHYTLNSKLSNEMTKDFINAGLIPLVVANRGKHNEVLTMASLNYEDENIKITGRHEFTDDDKLIHDTVCSLYVKGNRVIDAAQVYRHIRDLDPTYPIKKAELIKIDESIDKSRFMRLRVDYTAQAKLHGLDVDSTIIDSNLLSADVIIIKKGGHEVKAYAIKDTPPLYKYNAELKQIIAIKRELLGITGVDNTEENRALKMYLLKRIAEMKHNPKQTNKIKYETIFSELSINPSRDRKKKIRAKIIIMLQEWKDKKHITGFKEYKIGRTFEGVELQYKQDSPER